MKEPVTAIIVGAGHRALLYASYALEHPDELRILGVADPDPIRRRHAASIFGFGEDFCFESAEALAEKPRLADAVINGTMDSQHGHRQGLRKGRSGSGVARILSSFSASEP